MNDLRWTMEMPKQEGWYWRVRNTPNGVLIRVVNVYIDGKSLRCDAEPITPYCGYWAGPINEPMGAWKI